MPPPRSPRAAASLRTVLLLVGVAVLGPGGSVAPAEALAAPPAGSVVDSPGAPARDDGRFARGIHTELRESRPAADTAVQEVREVLLVFTTPVRLPLSRITVVGPDGAAVPSSALQHPDPESPDELVVRFPSPLPPGEYEVRWATAGPDGHPISDTFRFAVVDDPAGAPLPPAAEPVPPAPDAVPPGQEPGLRTLGVIPAGSAQRWLHLLATVLLLGLVVFRFSVLGFAARKGGLDAVRERAERGLRRFGWVAGGLLLVTLVTRLRYQLGELGEGDALAWDLLPYLLFRTAWGAGWGLHVAAIVLVAIGLVLLGRPGGSDRGWSTLAGAAILVPLVLALQGHAMASELRTMAVPVLYLHVAAAGAWLGGLLMLVLVGLPAVRKLPAASGGKPPLARLVNAFSRVGLVSVALFVATGVANVFLFGVAVGEVVGTSWGRTLVLKLAIVAAALLLGFHNWRRVRPSLEANPDPGALRIPATVEAILGIVVLLVTAALVAMPLP